MSSRFYTDRQTDLDHFGRGGGKTEVLKTLGGGQAGRARNQRVGVPPTHSAEVTGLKYM